MEILLTEDTAGILTLVIRDNGCGMSPEMVASVTDPFCTTRKTRKVGLGIPLLLQASEMAGGSLAITSKVGEGTSITATFDTKNIDCTPIGDMTSTLVTLVQGAPDTDFLFVHQKTGGEVRMDTRELRAMLGAEVPLETPEVLVWLREYLSEQYEIFGGTKA